MADYSDDLLNEPTDLVLVDVATGAITTIASEDGGTFEAAINHDGTRIVFESTLNLTGNNADGNEELFLFDVPTSTFTQISDRLEFDFASSPAAINGDGTKVVFTSEQDITGGNADGNAEVFHFDTNTSTFTQVTSSTGENPFVNIDENRLPTISADGSRIAFQSDRNLTGGNADQNFEIYYYDVATAVTTQVTFTTGGVGIDDIDTNTNASLTANGNIISFQSNRDITGSNPDGDNEIFTYNVSVDAFTQITDASSQSPFTYSSGRPLINSDGSRIAFDSTANLTGNNLDGNGEVFLFDTSGGLSQITDTTIRYGTSATTNLDGTLIAFSSSADLVGNNADGTAEIFLFDTTQSDFVQLTDSTSQRGFSGAVDLSSDGQHLVFVSTSDLTGNNPDQNAEVFTLDRSTMSFSQVTNTTGGIDFLPLGGGFSLEIAHVLFAPYINQDGSRLAFTLDQDLTGGNPDQNFEAFLFDVATSSFTQVTNTTNAGGVGSIQGFAASSDVTTLAMISSADFTGDNADGSKELFLYDVASSQFRQITDSSVVDFFDIREPALDGDGSIVLFQSDGDFAGQNTDRNEQLFAFDTATSTFSQITNESGSFFFQSVSASTISDDGTRIAYVSRENPNGFNPDNSSELFLLDTTTGQTAQITSTLGFQDFDDLTVIVPVISGDGDVIAYEGELVDISCDNIDLSHEIFAADVSSLDFSAAPCASRVCMDFGDAPQGIIVDGVLRQYPTLLPDGARHEFDVNSPFLVRCCPMPKSMDEWMRPLLATIPTDKATMRTSTKTAD